jgi:hypothetical protein
MDLEIVVLVGVRFGREARLNLFVEWLGRVLAVVEWLDRVMAIVECLGRVWPLSSVLVEFWPLIELWPLSRAISSD